MFSLKNYPFSKLVKSLKKSLTLSIIFFISSSFTYLKAGELYIYKKSNGEMFFTNIKPITVDNGYKSIKIIKYGSNSNALSLSPAYNLKSHNKPEIDTFLKEAAQTYKLDYKLLKAVALTESDLTHNVVSEKGAVGVMQLLPKTADRFGVRDIKNLEENIKGGAKYLKFLLEMFNNNSKFAVAAYNAGENSILKYNGVPPYPETQKYINKVFAFYKKLSNNEKIF